MAGEGLSNEGMNPGGERSLQPAAVLCGAGTGFVPQRAQEARGLGLREPLGRGSLVRGGSLRTYRVGGLLPWGTAAVASQPLL